MEIVRARKRARTMVRNIRQNLSFALAYDAHGVRRAGLGLIGCVTIRCGRTPGGTLAPVA